jgi:hypothetical protein
MNPASYRLTASCADFTLEAFVYPHGAKGYASAVLVDFRPRPGLARKRISDPAGSDLAGEGRLREMGPGFRPADLRLVRSIGRRYPL